MQSMLRHSQALPAQPCLQSSLPPRTLPTCPKPDILHPRGHCATSASSRSDQATEAVVNRRTTLGAAGLIASAAVLPQQALAEIVSLEAASGQSWLQQDSRQNLHVVHLVADIDATAKFYQDKFGMQLLRSRGYGDARNAFLGYGPEVEKGKVGRCAMELAYKEGVNSYRVGSGFLGFGIRAGGNTLSGGDLVTDPTGYNFRAVPAGSSRTAEPFAHVCLQVSDLDRSIAFYTQVLGMSLLRRDTENCAVLGYAPELQSTTFELVGSKKPRVPVDRGDGYVQMAVSTKDVYKTADQIRAAGGPITREPGPVPGIGTKIVKTADPDGWQFAFVDMNDFLNEFV